MLEHSWISARIVLLLMIWLMGRPDGLPTSRADIDPAARDRLWDSAVETLRREMETQNEWVKVHAAEGLLSANLPQGVQAEFERERAARDEVPQYRVGIWRVLARCATTDAARQEWVGKIQSVMVNPTSTDAGHAAETLGKLSASFPAELQQPARDFAARAQGRTAVLAAWALAADPQSPDRTTGISHLTQALQDPQPEIRGIAAYALRFVGNLPTPLWERLIEVTDREPATSSAHVYLLSAALCLDDHRLSDHQRATYHAALTNKANAARKADRYELCETLALIGTPAELPPLEMLLTTQQPLRDGLTSPATDAAIYDHPDNADVRVAAAKAILHILLRSTDAHVSAEANRNMSLGVNPHDWPWWRGFERNGIAPIGQTPPQRWSTSENVLWSTPIPGRGHGSATVVGDQVFLAAAEEDSQVQSVLCFDRQHGKLQWKANVHTGGFVKEGNEKTTHASGTVACDGERIYINFLNAGQVFTTALSRQGELLWQTPISDFVVHQGFGASPALYGPLVITSADHKGGGAIAGIDRLTGKIVWKIDRPEKANYTSPIILHAAGRDQLFFIGCDLVTSLDPLTGKTIWEIAGSTTECVTSTVTDGVRIFSSGGYPENHLAAIRADGSGKVEWKEDVRVYVPSILALDGYLYGVTDAGVAMCWKSETGATVWRGRLGGTFSASPVLVGNTIYATNEEGTTYLFQANPEKFQLDGKNQLGQEFFATPVFCGNRMYARVALRDGQSRQEMLYCIGSP